MWRAPRDFNKLVEGLRYVIENYSRCRADIIQTATNLNWYHRSKDLVDLFKRFA